jgi:mRNA-degrading endonuclease YafQ of YafQ-DinJ toxin-antitoxin module
MNVEFLKQFSKDLDNLVRASVKKQVAELIEELASQKRNLQAVSVKH